MSNDTKPAATALWEEVCSVVKAWHGADVFDLYRDHSPEMRRIKAAIDALAAPPPQVLTDEQCDAIADALDGWARDVDSYEYGLPLYHEDSRDRIRALVRDALLKAAP